MQEYYLFLTVKSFHKNAKQQWELCGINLKQFGAVWWFQFADSQGLDQFCESGTSAQDGLSQATRKVLPPSD
jgi:hypothetical protein